MKLPDTPRTGFKVADFATQVIRYLRSITIVGITGGKVKRGPNGTTIELSIPTATGGGGSSGPTICPFGEIIDYTEEETEKTGIKGGVVYAGDKVWNVPPYEIDLGTDIEEVIWLVTGVTANTDDDSEVILSGIKTSTEPEWDKAVSTTGYPDQEIPTNPATATGESVVACGILRIKDGAATFEKTGCGNIQITGCPGTLSHIRL